MMIVTETFNIPESKPVRTNAERQRDYRARNGAANKTRSDYRRRNSKWQTDAKYLSRPITFWDGEGVTMPDGTHRYTLFSAMSSTDHECHNIECAEGISTLAIFQFITTLSERYPGAINAIYGGSYDFNMWLKDLDRTTLTRLYKRGTVIWRGWKMTWRRGKSFYLRHTKCKKGVTIYDVLSFFQSPFVTACDSYLCNKDHKHVHPEGGYIRYDEDCWHERNAIIESKSRRGTFTLDEAKAVADYNEAELRNGIALLTELRFRLNAVTLRPARWDGPGAVAAALMQRERVKDARATCPPRVAQAARYAYAGGRFEVLKYGHVEKPAYEYDVNSAYPAAMRHVPNLNNGTWVHSGKDVEPRNGFALVRIESHATYSHLPAPLFARMPNGSICYPQSVIGWYWRPEYDSLVAYCEAGYGTFTILESWSFVEHDASLRPFGFIVPLYRERQTLKAARDGAHVGLKYGLNSLYGKCAQQIGAKQNDDGTWQIPPFHQLEWAGYATSYCRAAVLRAGLGNLDSVIAYETDALFTSEPLDVPISEDLGDFELEVFSDLTYVQSGIYFASHANGSSISKSRGVDKGNITRAQVIQAFTHPNADCRKVETTLTRFVTLGVALAQDFSRWTRWEQQTKCITVEPTGKRIHSPYCQHDENGPALGVWHETICPRMGTILSCEYPVEWINPDPLMDELTDLRNESAEQYDDI